MIPLSLVPALVFGIILGVVGFSMMFLEYREERRNGRKP
jgi:hypothetical protein